MTYKITLFWFRRDLRLKDNVGLFNALKDNPHVLPVFVFDTDILNKLPRKDARVLFIHQTISSLKQQLQEKGSDLIVQMGKPIDVFKKLASDYDIEAIYTNHDYEPYAIERDGQIKKWCDAAQIKFKTFKDQCIFEKSEVVADTGKPYTVYTPYKKKWLKNLTAHDLKSYSTDEYENNFLKVDIKSKTKTSMLTLKELNFEDFDFTFPPKMTKKSILENYAENRNFPALSEGTSKLGIHLRFGTISVREVAKVAQKLSDVWLSEIIWRDFFMQILWHYPGVQEKSFRPQYEKIAWRTNEKDFKKWCDGQTGYPLVDAGMRELNETGHMHNRVRMVVASFLTKHLLMHWSLGERYFAEKLLDYDLSANNGNWQWAAGTGCDAAPYFRVFNPETQHEKFDKDSVYVKKWVPEYGTAKYVNPMVEHVTARARALTEYKKGLT